MGLCYINSVYQFVDKVSSYTCTQGNVDKALPTLNHELASAIEMETGDERGSNIFFKASLT